MSKEILNIGVIGLGGRGYSLIRDVLVYLPNVKIIACCDEYQDRVDGAYELIEEKTGVKPIKFNDYKKLIKIEGLEAVIIAASWEAHVPIAVDVMNAGIPCGLEVGGAYSVEDCWKLVDTYEKTKTPFMFLENCCFYKSELLATVLSRTGKFGQIVHCSGAYSHDLRTEVLGGNVNRHYRLRNYLTRNCENYPTHELGPIAKILDINRGNRMLRLSSIASKAVGLEEYVNEHKDTIDKTLIGKKFAQGDIINTIITCENGETISLRLDTTLPTVYTRDFTVRGTKGMYNQLLNMVVLDGDDVENYFTPEEVINTCANNANKYHEYLPEMWRDITEEELERGHGGMDSFMLQKFVQCVLSGEEMPIDVYDAASWMVITCLSEISIKNNGAPVDIPDFTKGKYKDRKRKDVLDF